MHVHRNTRPVKASAAVALAKAKQALVYTAAMTTMMVTLVLVLGVVMVRGSARLFQRRLAMLLPQSAAAAVQM